MHGIVHHGDGTRSLTGRRRSLATNTTWCLLCSGITLEGPNASEVWDPEHKNDDSDGAAQDIGADQKLIIKMVSVPRSGNRQDDNRDVAVVPCPAGFSPPAVLPLYRMEPPRYRNVVVSVKHLSGAFFPLFVVGRAVSTALVGYRFYPLLPPCRVFPHAAFSIVQLASFGNPSNFFSLL